MFAFAAALLLLTGAAMAQSGPRTESFSSGGVPIAVDVFEAAGSGGGARPALLLLHGADGLTVPSRYRTAASFLAASGYQVFLPHYLDRTGQSRASFSTIYTNFAAWQATVQDAVTYASRSPGVDARRIGIVGISLGAALALSESAQDPRVKAVVEYFGPLPQGLGERARRLPPTLILHGTADPIVPVANASGIEALLKRLGTPYEIQIYPGEGHGFSAATQVDAARRASAFLNRYLRSGARASASRSDAR